MLITTSDSVAEKQIEKTFGLVKGEIVQSKHLGRDFMAGMKTLVGGELKGYTQMIDEARKEATARMIKEAEELGNQIGVQIILQHKDIFKAMHRI